MTLLSVIKVASSACWTQDFWCSNPFHPDNYLKLRSQREDWIRCTCKFNSSKVLLKWIGWASDSWSLHLFGAIPLQHVHCLPSFFLLVPSALLCCTELDPGHYDIHRDDVIFYIDSVPLLLYMTKVYISYVQWKLYNCITSPLHVIIS